MLCRLGTQAGVDGTRLALAKARRPDQPVDQSLINFTYPGQLRSPQGLSDNRPLLC